MSAADTMSVQPTGAGRVVPSSSFDFAPLLREGDVVSWPQGPGEPLGLTGRLMATRHALTRASLLLGLLTQTPVATAAPDRFDQQGGRVGHSGSGRGEHGGLHITKKKKSDRY